MAEKKANFVPVSALDKRPRSNAISCAGWCGRRRSWRRIFSFIFATLGRRRVLRTKVVAPYAVTFYVTHKCNLACSLLHAKEPDVFSEELPTRETIRLLKRIRKETDSIVITGGEPTLRPDIEELVEAARLRMQIPFPTAHYQWHAAGSKAADSASGDGLVVSLDALAADPTNPLSKPAALPKVLENLELAKSCWAAHGASRSAR